jgi:hypothetical protein
MEDRTRGLGPTTRGRPLHVFQPTGRGLAAGAIIVFFGLALIIAAGQWLMKSAPHEPVDALVLGGFLLADAAVFGGGVALAVKAARHQLLVFENGFVLRDRRGRERFVRWERLRKLEVQSGLAGGSGPLVAWIDPKEEGSQPEKMILGTATEVGDPKEVDTPGIAAVLAEHAGLDAGPRGRLSWSGQRWTREDDDGG